MLKDRRIQAALVSIAVNGLLVIIKFWGAGISSSRGMQADALHSLSDIGVSALVFLSVFAARKTAQWGRIIEGSIALVIGAIILWVGLNVLWTPDYSQTQDTLTQIPLAVGLTWVCILITYFVSRYKMRIGRDYNAVNLCADAHHSRMDMYSSVAVLVGLVGAWSGFNLDGVASLVVGLLIIRIGFVVVAATFQSILQPDVSVMESMDRMEYARNWTSLLSALFVRVGLAPDIPDRVVTYAQTLIRRRKKILVSAAGLIIIGTYFASGIYVVGPDELGVLTRFGRLTNPAVQPGLHYRLPSPLSTVYLAKPDRVYQIEFGFRTTGQRGITEEPEAYLWESQHQSGIYDKRLEEAIMLTGDKNEVDMNLTIEYRLLPDALPDFYFHASVPEDTVRALAQRSMQEILGCKELTDILTVSRIQIETELKEALTTRLDTLQLGVRITAVRLQDVHPPTEVVSAFRAVATAREKKSTLIHKAEAYRNETLPKARGEAAYLASDAEAYVYEKSTKTSGEAEYFRFLALAYTDFPEAVTFLRYLDTAENTLSPVRKVVFDDKLTKIDAGKTLSQYFLGMEFHKWPLGSYVSSSSTGSDDSSYYEEEEEED